MTTKYLLPYLVVDMPARGCSHLSNQDRVGWVSTHVRRFCESPLFEQIHELRVDAQGMCRVIIAIPDDVERTAEEAIRATQLDVERAYYRDDDVPRAVQVAGIPGPGGIPDGTTPGWQALALAFLHRDDCTVEVQKVERELNTGYALADFELIRLAGAKHALVLANNKVAELRAVMTVKGE